MSTQRSRKEVPAVGRERGVRRKNRLGVLTDLGIIKEHVRFSFIRPEVFLQRFTTGIKPTLALPGEGIVAHSFRHMLSNTQIGQTNATDVRNHPINRRMLPPGLPRPFAMDTDRTFRV